ncbi:VQ domain-containing protein [Psidium guajava]|nr:VQ domain-containing protein [Psidium guajava]
MNSDFPAGKSPRRELQGPRPAPLKVRKDSYKIRKPPVVPQQQPQLSQQLPAQPRPPVIIYAVSPKVIHTNPSEFMSLVQRLTGASSTYVPSPAASGGVSPAARFATVEKAKPPEGKQIRGGGDILEEIESMGQLGHSGVVERTGSIPGILSPGPASLQPIPTTFFSPLSDPNPLSFLHDLSPALYSNKNHFAEGSFLLQSSSPFISPRITSPAPSLDFFSNFFDL